MNKKKDKDKDILNVSFRKLDNGEIVAVKKKNKKIVSKEERKKRNKINKKIKK